MQRQELQQTQIIHLWEYVAWGQSTEPQKDASPALKETAQKSGHGKVQDSTKNHLLTLMPEHLIASGNTFLVIFQGQDYCHEIVIDGFVQL